jgi:hypothetical protein
MKRPSYVPTRNEIYNSWQKFLNTQVNLNAVAWGIPAGVITDFNTMFATFAVLFGLIENEPTRTKPNVANYNAFKKDYTTFLRSLVQGYLVNNVAISVGDKVGMGLNPRLGGKGNRVKIQTLPIMSIINLGGSNMQFQFKVQDGGPRPAIHPDADEVELSYTIMPLNAAPGTPPSEAGTYSSTRGSFSYIVGLDFVGQRLIVRSRWVNATDPEKSGGWSGEFGIVIS